MLYTVYINDDPGLTLTYFVARSNWATCMFEWEKLLQSHLMELYKVYINDDPGLTLTYFICFCTSSRPRYQVSVYRTIGPLVLISQNITAN